jgi:hypothetical protein
VASRLRPIGWTQAAELIPIFTEFYREWLSRISVQVLSPLSGESGDPRHSLRRVRAECPQLVSAVPGCSGGGGTGGDDDDEAGE